MKKVVIVILIGVLLSLGLSSGALCARGGGHGGGGGHFGGGWHGGGYHGYYGGWRGGPWRGWYGFGPWWGYPYAYPYYYPYRYSSPYPSYPNAYAQPPAYSEPEQPSYWYYCQDPQGYYPYVKNCPGGWMSVLPTPQQPGTEEGPVK